MGIIYGNGGFVRGRKSLIWTFDNLLSKTLWLDIDDPSTINLNGSTISQLTEKANGVSLTESAASNQPLYVPNAFNSKAVARFSGNQRLTSPTTSDYNSIGFASVFGIFKRNTTTIEQILNISPVGFVTARILASIRDGTGNYAVGGRRLDNDSFQQIEGGSNADYIIYGATINYQTRQLRLYVNGLLVASSDTFQMAGVTQNNDTNIVLGNNQTLSNGFNGDVGEIVSTTQTVLTLDDVDRIHGRLAHKWLMTNVLPTNHPYKINPPLI